MEKEIITKILKQSEALISGHFELSSGLHSSKYIQCQRVFQYPKYAMQMGKALGDQFRRDRISVVVGLALGSIILAHEVAKSIGARSVFAERQNGQMALRRGFEIKNSDRVLIVEDVITTGGSVKEVLKLLKGKCRIAGVGALAERAKEKVQFRYKYKYKYKYLIKLQIDTFEKDKCPLCAKEVPVIKPGSRKI